MMEERQNCFIITVHNCWDCPFRERNVGGKVPHYCTKARTSMCDEDYPKHCPFHKKGEEE